MAKAKAASGKKPMTKGVLIQTIAEAIGDPTSKKVVKAVLEALQDTGHKELKKNGVFLLPGFAKFMVVKKPARPAREGINPFTKEPMTFEAKPASKTVRARPVKAAREAVA